MMFADEAEAAAAVFTLVKVDVAVAVLVANLTGVVVVGGVYFTTGRVERKFADVVAAVCSLCEVAAGIKLPPCVVVILEAMDWEGLKVEVVAFVILDHALVEGSPVNMGLLTVCFAEDVR
eukprot:CAMPEP_0115365718 /NCGR_PEP_ID=MMETSP0270-20121206/104429_1 /TAXON_ID=71861 /ORGANISM="Scrippsiella trochoidea, Strain CCMP3099" /LENGTH=119 /DNA_ID=CAMNT_0002788457 /DNA_START=196 /DNA_END=556 /DNA_ORIENTATION=-